MSRSVSYLPDVIITGATGFLGRRVLRALLAVDAKVTIVARSTSVLTPIADLLPRLNRICHNTSECAEELSAGRPHAVLHLATCYGRRGERPSEILEANVALPLRLLELLPTRASTVFINADTFYTASMSLPDGMMHYARTKHQFRELARQLAETRELRLVNMRVHHMYGPGDSEEKFIPFVLRALLERQATLPLTGGSQRRDFIYVDDVVSAVMAIIRARERLSTAAQDVDVGSGESVSVREMVELAKDIVGSDTALRFGELPYRAGEIMDGRADTRRMREFGWQAEVSLRDGLTRSLSEIRGRSERKSNDGTHT